MCTMAHVIYLDIAGSLLSDSRTLHFAQAVHDQVIRDFHPIVTDAGRLVTHFLPISNLDLASLCSSRRTGTSDGRPVD